MQLCFAPQCDSGSLGCYFSFISCADLIKPQSLLETVPVVGMSEADPFVLCINQNHNVKIPFESSYIESNLDATCLNIHVWPRRSSYTVVTTSCIQFLARIVGCMCRHVLLTCSFLQKVAPLSKSLWVAHVKYASLTPETQTFRQGVTGQSIIHRLSNPHSLPPPVGQLGSLKDFSNVSLLLILLCW